jgi:PKD repeat protein
VHFDASSSTGEAAYSWDFDDGTTASTAVVDHGFSGAVSTYNVILTVTGPGGSDAAFVTIHVPCA